MSQKIIQVDHRENAEMILRELRERYEIEIKEIQLKMGDYKIYPDTVIERKTINDFCLSIIDGRLFRQTFQLIQFTANPILLIEGENFKNRKYAISIEAIKGALATLAQTYRLPVIRSKDQVDSAWYVNTFLRQRKRVGQNSGILTGHRPKKINTQRQVLLRTLPGLGPKIAKAVLKEFQTVEGLVKASKEELENVPWIGEKTAEKIYNVLHEEESPYHS